MLALQGLGVLVTRPAHQAAPLCRLFELQGAVTFRFPAIAIHPLADSRQLAARLGPMAAFDLIIFASANAVRFGANLLGEQRDLTLAAIGPATARALNQAGYRVTVQTSAGFDTESLLRHPKLASVAGNRVLLVKGRGGRELLAQELERRGATIEEAVVYERQCPDPGSGAIRALESLFAAGSIQLVTATSADIARNLATLATPDLKRSFESAHWLVPGERVGRSVQEAGVGRSLVMAASAEDQDLVSAAARWRASVSGA